MQSSIENPTVSFDKASHAGKYLTFALGKESYGIEVLKIREIIRMQEITKVPQMPPHVKGVINLRGKIIPVMDLRVKFNLQNIQDTESTCIVVVNLENEKKQNVLMGVIVDGVEEVAQIASTDIEESPHFGSSMELSHILGMAKIKGNVKTLLDINRIIDSEAISQLKQTVQSAEE